MSVELVTPLVALALLLGVTGSGLLRARRVAPPVPVPRRDEAEESELDEPAASLDAPYPFFGGLRSRGAPVSTPTLPVFLAICEIDRFEAIRRNIGSVGAGALVAQLSGRIAEHLPGAQIGRTGRASIEAAFAAASAEEARALLTGLLVELDRPVSLGDCRLDLVVRIGFVETPGDRHDDKLIECIEVALAAAASAHERIVRAGSVEDLKTTNRLELLRDLQHAIRTDALELRYQPKLRCAERSIDSAEALLRWTHPALGPVAPDEFIRMAEDTGSIRPLTHWVIARAVVDQARLRAAGHDLTIYVNISGQLLPDRDFAEAALAQVEAAGGAIGFEITETAVIGDPVRALENLNAWAAAGIKIAIDDYGSGLSSLAYLKQLPAQELKIDRLFISGLTTSHRDPLLVRSSIDLAHALEMEVTAEGVDNPMTLSLLRVMGCDLIQGYLLSPPLALPELLDFLRRDNHTAHFADQRPAFLQRAAG